MPTVPIFDNARLISLRGALEPLKDAYHAIRKAEIFVPLGLGDHYDPEHPDEHKDGNLPFVFLVDGWPIGTIRLDCLQAGPAALGIVRLVAITKTKQRRGFGKLLMEEIEAEARRHSYSILVINANVSALSFYQKLGYAPCPWDDPSEGIGADIVQMAKIIA